jgi:uncharacterized protein (TIGR00369 family)
MTIEGKIEFQILEQTPEQVISEMPIRPGVKNPYGVVNAGAILWLADVTATKLVMGPAWPGKGMAGFPLAVTLNANFVSNQKAGSLRAIASYVKKGKTINVVRTTVLGENGKLIADVTTNHVTAKQASTPPSP